jgi:hypothetical protein
MRAIIPIQCLIAHQAQQTVCEINVFPVDKLVKIHLLRIEGV